jgi:hypothetical protein
MKLSVVILCTALTALLASCGESSSKTALNKNNATDDGGGNTIQPVPDKFIQLNEDEIQRDCSASEVQSLKTYEQLIQNSNSSVTSTKGKKDDKVIAAGISAIQACDEVIRQVSSAGACRISRTTINGLKFSYYDGYRIDQKCKTTEKYLTAHDARPAKNQPAVTQPPVVEPVDPNPGGGPVVVNPPVEQPPVAGGPLRQCSEGEFEKLKSSMSSVDLATTQISKQGQFSSWKYESDAIANAALGAKSCEALIAYHDQNPCERSVTKADGSKTLRQYTGTYLRQRCETTRTYFYEFVQNTKTLNFQNADLYLDVSGFEEKVFDTVPVQVQGCIVENRTDHAIDYSGRGKVLVKDSRGFSDKMMVLETTDGLVVQCYGLKVDGPFSKREVVNLFKKDGTNMPLSYQLK